MTRCLLLLVLLCVGTSISAQESLKVIHDLYYRLPDETDDYARERCKLDVYIPTNKTTFPTVVWFHGGGLETGDRSGEKQWATSMASAGIAVAVVNYRLSPKVMYPAYLQDAAMAVAYVHREIPTYGGDRKRVFVAGHSAGGYLTAMIILDPQWLKAVGLNSHDIAGAVPVSGQMTTHSTVRKERGIPRTEEVIDAAAPLAHAHAQVPPLFFITADHDMAGRSQENRRMHAALKACGNTAVFFHEFSDRNHGTIKSAMSDEHDPARLALIAFVMNPTATEQTPSSP